jgi:hypothetical protein
MAGPLSLLSKGTTDEPEGSLSSVIEVYMQSGGDIVKTWVDERRRGAGL